MSESRNALKPGYALLWYRIRSVLGQGGFGITYLADDTNLNQPVAIKEFLPVEMAMREGDASVQPVSGEHGEQFRWGLDRFISEAQTLAQFKHPNIVRVFTVFTENHTAYMVMEYESGQGLHEVLKERKTLPEAELLAVLMPILDGLEQVHARGFIHRDIKPANIYLRTDGSPVLLDFGSARQALGERSRTLTAMVSPGFAPFEQYTGTGSKQGPWTDIYGLAATLYRAVTGRAPADAMNRSEALLQAARDVFVPAAEIRPEGYSTRLLAAIDRGLAFRADERPQSINAWRREFENPGASQAEPVATRATLRAPAQDARIPDTIRIIMDGGSSNVSNSAAPDRLSRRRVPAAWLAGMAVVLLVGALALRKSAPESPVQPVVPEAVAVVATDAPLPTTPDQAPASNAAASPAGSDSKVEREPASAKTAVVVEDSAPVLVGPRERARLAAIRRQLRRNPDDPEARRQLRVLSSEFDQAVKKAISEQEYDRAEAYINEMLALTPDNQKLKDALQAIAREKGRH